jgi:hypothetical protein
MSIQPVAVRALPRPANRFQLALLACAFAAAALLVAAPVRAAGGDGLRRAANEHRTHHGLNAVVGTALLDNIAVHRAAKMANADEMEHDLAYLTDRLNAAGVCYAGYGEIIAWESGYPDYSFDRTMDLWWHSDPHRAIMMGAAYNAAGGAWDTSDSGGHYSVMVFVTLCSLATTNTPVHVLRPSDAYSPDRVLVFDAGRVTGYRFSSAGNVLSKRTVKFSTTARATSGGRAKVNDKHWLKVSSGPLAGYWVHESPSAHVRGMTERVTFEPDRRLVTEAGGFVGRKFDWLGRVVGVRWYSFGDRRTPGASARAIINGRRYFQFSSGPLAGYWVPDGVKVYPR